MIYIVGTYRSDTVAPHSCSYTRNLSMWGVCYMVELVKDDTKIILLYTKVFIGQTQVFIGFFKVGDLLTVFFFLLDNCIM